MLLVEASIRAHVRPTTMILGADNRKKWSPLDLLIMQAYEQYQREICPDCGMPLWLCRNPDPRLQVRVKKTSACYAKSEVEKERKKQSEDDEESLRPEFYARDDTPLHAFRDSYYEGLRAEADEAENDAV